ncbi:MAG: hypothetical protein ACC661_04670, partial [Verrucomicrobiales bacterium]
MRRNRTPFAHFVPSFCCGLVLALILPVADTAAQRVRTIPRAGAQQQPPGPPAGGRPPGTPQPTGGKGGESAEQPAAV